MSQHRAITTIGVALAIGAAFVAGRISAPGILGDSGADDRRESEFCALAVELVETDQALLDNLPRRWQYHDLSAVQWRQLVGELRAMTHFHDPMAEFEDRSDAIGEVQSATLTLERAKLGLKHADEAWDTETVEAALLLDSALDSLCGVRFSPSGYLRASL